jgi:hypothetical protein
LLIIDAQKRHVQSLEDFKEIQGLPQVARKSAEAGHNNSNNQGMALYVFKQLLQDWSLLVLKCSTGPLCKIDGT